MGRKNTSDAGGRMRFRTKIGYISKISNPAGADSAGDFPVGGGCFLGALTYISAGGVFGFFALSIYAIMACDISITVL